MLGRNPAYIQQFVRRGVPKRLKEAERRKLARYFSISESLLGGPSKRAKRRGYPAGPSAFPCAHRRARRDRRRGDRQTLFRFRRALAEGADADAASKLSIIRVEGDSMAPTLNAGDDILIDPIDCEERLRDGIYVLRVDDALVVKRIALNPVGRRVTVQSDNPAYPDWPDCGISTRSTASAG
jgi:hypothetical protein